MVTAIVTVYILLQCAVGLLLNTIPGCGVRGNLHIFMHFMMYSILQRSRIVIWLRGWRGRGDLACPTTTQLMAVRNKSGATHTLPMSGIYLLCNSSGNSTKKV